jgi:hypothetical protein
MNMVVVLLLRAAFDLWWLFSGNMLQCVFWIP